MNPSILKDFVVLVIVTSEGILSKTDPPIYPIACVFIHIVNVYWCFNWSSINHLNTSDLISSQT